MLVNLRGFKSKEVSLKKILKQEMPNMILLNETLLAGRVKVSLPAYKCWSKNRTEKGGGGVATGVSKEYMDSAVGVGEGEEGDELIITRIEQFNPALNIINCYGEQRKCSKEDVEEKWGRLRKIMEDIRAKGEFCTLIGDLNKLVGRGEGGVAGNHPEISLGGRLLLDLVSTGNWFIVNGLGPEVVEGGPFTRKDPATGNGSCLDLFVVSKKLLPYVSTLKIDSDRNMAVSRAVKIRQKYERVYSDHFTCILTFHNLPKGKEEKVEKKVVWNLAKEGGWDKYRLLTDQYSESIERTIEKEDEIEMKMKQFNKIHEKIKFRAFGKVTIGDNTAKEQAKQKDASKEESAKELFEDQVNKVNEEINDIKSKKKSKVGQIWDIRKKVLGGKKAMLDTSAFIHPKSGKLVVSKAEILQVSLDYCKDTLRNNIPAVGHLEDIQKKKESVRNKLLLCHGSFQIEKETFNSVVNKFRKSGKKTMTF